MLSNTTFFMKNIYFIFLCLLSWMTTRAQNVSTLFSHPELRDGLHVDANGNIYSTSGGLAGSEIGKYDFQTQEFNPFFAQGFFGPVDVDIYQDSLLIVSNYDNNTLAAYHLQTGEITYLATGLDGPSGIAIDSSDNIYVASWGGAPLYAGHQIHRIDSTGQVSNYIDSPLLYRPQAMTINQDQQLIFHSVEKLYKVNPQDSTLALWISLETGVGHMVFRQKDSCIYAAANGEHQILRISVDGTVSLLAGSSKGYKDGPLDMALFNTPLGIELSPEEDQLYVCESAYAEPIGRIRSIDLDQTVWVTEVQAPSSSQVYPNPSKDFLQIDQGKNIPVHIRLFDTTGKIMRSTWGNESLIELDLSGLSSGIYFLNLEYPEGIISHKIVRE